jgi:hypothetical protein
MSIAKKYERDIDLLLAEEFVVNPSFAEQFKALTGFQTKKASVAEYWVSKSDKWGESDLIVVYESNLGGFALLIEDKVDAPLQPDQAQRYRLRADRDCTRGIYNEYEVVLCAPQYYIDNRSDLDGFDRRIPLEKLAEIIRTQNDRRAEYRAKFLETAATKRINAWKREDDRGTNEFWDAAYELASREFPELEMKKLEMTKNSTWISLRPHDFPTQPKRIYLILKGGRGQIDLTFSNTIAPFFRNKIEHLLESDMSVHQTTASAAIRIETTKFRIADGVEAGMPKLREAFEACSRLIALYRRTRAELDKAAKDATRS